MYLTISSFIILKKVTNLCERVQEKVQHHRKLLTHLWANFPLVPLQMLLTETFL